MSSKILHLVRGRFVKLQSTSVRKSYVVIFENDLPLISLMWMVHRVCWVPCVCTSTFIHKFKLNELSTKNKQGILDQSTWSKLLLFDIPPTLLLLLLVMYLYTHRSVCRLCVYRQKEKMSGNQIKREKFSERLEYSVVPKAMTSNLASWQRFEANYCLMKRSGGDILSFA